MIPEVWQFSSDLNNCISCSSLHQPCFQYKVTHRTASQVLHAFVHSIPHSFVSDWDWSWNSCSNQKGSQVSTDLVGSNRGRREHLTKVGISVNHCSPSFVTMLLIEGILGSNKTTKTGLGVPTSFTTSFKASERGIARAFLMHSLTMFSL